MQPKVLCIGSCSKDIFFPVEDGLLLETPEDITSKEKICFETGAKYKAKERYEAVGGVAANVAHGLARYGILSACYSKIGGDDIGAWIKKTLSEAGVETKTLLQDNSLRSDLSAIIVLAQNGERVIFHNRDANEQLEIIPEKMPETEWIFVSALNGNWKKNLEKILERVQEKNIQFGINPGQHNIRDDAEAVLRAIAHADIVSLNKDEAIELLLSSKMMTETDKSNRINDEEFLIQSLHAVGAKVISLSDGMRGAWASDGHNMYHCSIVPNIKAVDMTGAGDSFTAAFFASCIDGNSLEDSLRYGIVNGGNVVRFFGANEGHLSKKDLAEQSADLQIEKVR